MVSKARLLLHRKRLYEDGAISEVRLWRLPGQPVPGSKHPFKYSLFYGYPGHLSVAYDNEFGKGDHRHRGNIEQLYVFESLEKLLADVSTLRKKGGAA